MQPERCAWLGSRCGLSRLELALRFFFSVEFSGEGGEGKGRPGKTMGSSGWPFIGKGRSAPWWQVAWATGRRGGHARAEGGCCVEEGCCHVGPSSQQEGEKKMVRVVLAF